MALCYYKCYAREKLPPHGILNNDGDFKFKFKFINYKFKFRL